MRSRHRLKSFCKCLLTCAVLAGAATHSVVSVAQASIEDVLENVFGSYTLTFDLDDDLADGVTSPIADGARVNFVIAPANRLCTDDLSLSSATVLGNPLTAVSWQNALSNVRFDVRLTDTDPDPADTDYSFSDIQFRNSAGVVLGVFSLVAAGDYNASTGSCGASSDASDTQIEALLDSAENAFPALFPEGPFTFTQKSGDYTFRYYGSTSIYLAVSGGQVYARGGGYGNSYQVVGSVSNLSTTITNIIRPATIDSFFVGTYQTEMSDTQPFSIIADGAEITYAINSSGQLCLSTGSTLSNPVYLNNNTDVAVWREDAANLSYRLSLDAGDDDEELSAADGLLQVYSSSGQRFGELSGERISLEAICQTVSPTHPDTQIIAEIERLFQLAEQLYPEFATFGPTVRTQRTATYTFRYYPITNVSIAVRGGLVYTSSGQPDFSEPTLGTLDQVFTMLGESTRDFVPASSLVGTYDALVSNANPLSSLPNNSRIRLVIAASGALCIDNITLNNPTTLRASTSDVSWTNIQAGIHASMTLSDTAGPVNIALTSTRGGNLATLTANRVSPMATCPQHMMSAQEIDLSNELFALAELRYPEFFPASSLNSTRNAGGALVRQYPATDITITAVNGDIYVRGGSFGSAEAYVGSITDLRNQLQADLNLQGASGQYSVQITGTARVVIAGMAAVTRSININTMSAYSLSDLTDSALTSLASSWLSGEIQNPDSVDISNIVRSGSNVSFSAQLQKANVIGGASQRTVTANFILQAQ